MLHRVSLALLIGLLLLVAACSRTPAQPAVEEANEPAVQVETAAEADDAPAAEESAAGADVAAEEVTDTDTPAAGSSAAVTTTAGAEASTAAEAEAAQEAVAEATSVERPAWQQLALTNARTGETFTLADFAGKTIFVEPMATWCTNCRRQLGNVSAARGQLNSDDVVFIGISVETNISEAQLVQYADDAGFDWLFAVATPELLQELVANFGQTITNPPSTPHFIIRGDGTTTELVTGIESPEQIIAQLDAARG